ncbi:MAG: D-tyrosyl-tRNA(Tyr) deacylase [Rhodospirillaceae bacterium]|nr:D-tyrosyl-tRNA(Tyr) deacylase [Rhodospirillaceae bacterium]
MRALLQRVTEASVKAVETDEVLGAIGPGLAVLVCTMDGDDETDAEKLARKVARIRIFDDPDGKMNLSVGDTDGSILAISQFTLAADTRKGNRPSFSGGADFGTAERLYGKFVEALRAEGASVETGRFRTHMQVALVNDGPVTIWIDTAVV